MTNTQWLELILKEQQEAQKRISKAQKELSDAEFAHACSIGALNLLQAMQAEEVKTAIPSSPGADT